MIVIAATQKPSNDIVPTYRPGPLLLPHGAALHDPRGLRHHPRAGLGQGGLLGLDARPDDPRRGLPAWPRARSRSRSAPTTSTTTPSPTWRSGPSPTVAIARGRSEVGGRVAGRAGRGRPGRPVRPPGPPARPHLGPLERRAGRRRPARRLQGPARRRVPVVLPPLPGRRLAARRRRHPRRQRRQPVGGRPPPALRDADRPLVRAGAPERCLGRCDPGRAGPGAARGSARTGAPSRARAATAPTTRWSGEPLCPECFDYRGAVLWNAHVSALWARTVHRLYREVARTAGLSTRAAARGGPALLHQGGGVPSPRARPPPRRRPRRRRGRAERAAAALARRGGAEQRRRSCRRRSRRPGARRRGDSAAPGPLGRPTRRPGTRRRRRCRRHGHRRLRGQVLDQDRRRDDLAGAPGPLPGRDRAPGAAPPHRGHGQDDVGARAAGGTSLPLRLRDHAHTLGYPGQFSSKSVAFSTTFGALRRARADYVHGVRGGDSDTIRLRHDFDYDGEWRYTGRGYGDPEADVLAAALLESAPGGLPPGSRRFPLDFPERFPNAMTRENGAEIFLSGDRFGNHLRKVLGNPMWRDGAMTEPTPPFQRLSDHVASMAHSPEADRLAVRIARSTASGRAALRPRRPR